MIRPHECWKLLVVLLVVSAAQAAPAPKDEGSASVSFPGGVADPGKNVAYVVNTVGGIDAIDLDKGDLLWETKDPAKPIALSGKKLLAQVPVKDKANALRIVILDTTEKGKKISESDPITFPDWVSIGAGYGRSFTSSGRVHDGDLLLSWEARAWYAGGARPTPDIEERARKNEKGIARINLESGKIEMLSADKAPAEVKLPKEVEKVASQQYWTGAEWQTKPLVAGKVVAALESKDLGGGKARLSLNRWDLSGKQYESATLLEGKSLWPQITSDGRHLLVHQGLVKEQLPEGDYAWWVFDLESGKQVAKFPFESALTNPIVIGSRLYFVVSGPRKFTPETSVQPRAVRALDLKTGKVAWEHSIEGVTILPPLP